jgi:hypothetical protein
MQSVGYSPMLTFDFGAHQERKASWRVRTLGAQAPTLVLARGLAVIICRAARVFGIISSSQT